MFIVLPVPAALVVTAVCHGAQSVAKPDHWRVLDRRRAGFDLARRLVSHCWCGVDCIRLWCCRRLVELRPKRIDLLQQHQDRPAHRPLLPLSSLRQCNRPLPQLTLLFSLHAGIIAEPELVNQHARRVAELTGHAAGGDGLSVTVRT